MSMRLDRLLLIVLGLALAFQPAEAQDKKKRRGDQNRLTRIELDEAGSSIATARDAVRVLRPQWLSPPMGRLSGANMDGGPGGMATEVVVYIDGRRQADLESLVTVTVAEISEMRFLDQNRGIQMHGPGHEMGVIELTTLAKKK